MCVVWCGVVWCVVCVCVCVCLRDFMGLVLWVSCVLLFVILVKMMCVLVVVCKDKVMYIYLSVGILHRQLCMYIFMQALLTTHK